MAGRFLEYPAPLLPEHFENYFCIIESVLNYEARLAFVEKTFIQKEYMNGSSFFNTLRAGVCYIRTWKSA